MNDILDQVEAKPSSLFIKDNEGKPRFLGVEDPKNPPVSTPKKCNHGTDECSHMKCPKCGAYVDYLLGEGNEQGCLNCYK